MCLPQFLSKVFFCCIPTTNLDGSDVSNMELLSDLQDNPMWGKVDFTHVQIHKPAHTDLFCSTYVYFVDNACSSTLQSLRSCPVYLWGECSYPAIPSPSARPNICCTFC